jgi:hypothetical protein
MGTLGTTGMIIKLKLLLESMKYMYWKRKNSIVSLTWLLNPAGLTRLRSRVSGFMGQPGSTQVNPD